LYTACCPRRHHRSRAAPRRLLQHPANEREVRAAAAQEGGRGVYADPLYQEEREVDVGGKRTIRAVGCHVASLPLPHGTSLILIKGQLDP
jgi:hypothetical protein